MRFLNLTIMMILLLARVSSSAQCPTTNAYFANGMFNDYNDARVSLNKLKHRFRRQNPISFKRIVRWQMAYNTNETVLLQIWQVFDQKRAEVSGNFWSAVYSLMKKSEDARRSIQEILAKFSREQSLKDSDLRTQMLNYIHDLKSGYSIVTIAHSQGNLYSLFAFERLRPLSSQLHLFGVANPASRSFEEDAYVTLESDGVINAIPFALPPNASKPNSSVFDHRFVEDYLGSPEATEDIFDALDRKDKSEWAYDLLARGRFNSNLEPVVQVLRDRFASNTKLTVSECFIYWILMQLKQNLPPIDDYECSAIDLNAVLKAVNDCIWDLEPHETFGKCIFGAHMGTSSIPVYDLFNVDRLLKNNASCDWNTMDDLRRYLGAIGARGARDILLAPK